MPKRVAHILICLSAVAVIMGGCTQNNGDISPYFGFWRLDLLEADGIPVSDYGDNQVWSFQSGNICISEYAPHHERTDHWGTWRDDDGRLILDFDHHDDFSSEGMYRAPAILGFPDDAEAVLEIEAQTSHSMTLSQISRDGTLYTYTLSKIYQ